MTNDWKSFLPVSIWHAVKRHPSSTDPVEARNTCERRGQTGEPDRGISDEGFICVGLLEGQKANAEEAEPGEPLENGEILQSSLPGNVY